MKRTLPVMIAFCAGSLYVIAFFSPKWFIQTASQKVNAWIIIIEGFALLLGVVSIIQIHTKRIIRQDKGWGFSLIMMSALFIMAGLGIWPGSGRFPDGSLKPFTWMYYNMQVPLQATMFSMLAFYISSAAYRAFRARTPEATLLLCAAFLVMLGRIPVGEMIWTKIPMIQEWIMNTPSMAAQRGIIVGAALGAAAMCLRVIIGIERPYMGSSE